MIAAILPSLEIDLAHILIAKIHERAFKATTTPAFPVPHFPALLICFCSYLALWPVARGDQKVGHRPHSRWCQPFCTIERALGWGTTIECRSCYWCGASPDWWLYYSSPQWYTSSTLHCHQPGHKLIPSHTLFRVYYRSSSSSPKLETQLAILLQRMKPWMQHYIVESEARMEQMMVRKIPAVHKRPNALSCESWRGLPRPLMWQLSKWI